MRFDGMDSWLAFGTVGRPHGVQGEVYLHAYNPNARVPDRMSFPSELRLEWERTLESATIESFRGSQGRFRVRIRGIETREAAAALTNRIVLLPKSCFSPLAPEEFYVADILGWGAETVAAVPVGTVETLSWNGAHDVVGIVSPSGEEHLVPVVPDFILRLDRDRRVVVVDLHE